MSHRTDVAADTMIRHQYEDCTGIMVGERVGVIPESTESQPRYIRGEPASLAARQRYNYIGGESGVS